MFESIIPVLNSAQKIVVIQAENPDGDSLGSALALEEILSDLGKTVHLYCAIDIPRYLHYVSGWDRVEKDWPNNCDLAVIVDTSSETLLQASLEVPGVRHFLETNPVVVLDHHSISEKGNLSFPNISVNQPEAVATGQIIYELCQQANWAINQSAAENLFISIQADSLGLTTQNTNAQSYQVAASLVALGASPSDIEARRREYMKKPADILAYKGRLIERIEYHLQGALATVHVPWSEIAEFSDRYNPSVLVLDEMRFVQGVEVAVAIKTYPDGKLTGKIRTNLPIADTIAGYFGGGGHGYAAGFKVYDDLQAIMKELLTATKDALDNYDSALL